jgi:hypothetical protein
MPSDRVPSFEILHLVHTATTIAGAIETLMRRGSYVDVVLTSTRFDSSLGDDIIQYSRALAPNAQLIVLSEASSRAGAIELVLARPSLPDNQHAIGDWD